MDYQTNSNRRLRKEFQTTLERFPPLQEDTLRWKILERDLHRYRLFLSGPANTPFEGGEYLVDLTLPEDFPETRPEVRFHTRIFHPFVEPIVNGLAGIPSACPEKYCKTEWNPETSVAQLFEEIWSLLSTSTPPGSSIYSRELKLALPINKEAEDLLQEGWGLYDYKARTFNNKYAGGPPPPSGASR